jgi:hypothetical protein
MTDLTHPHVQDYVDQLDGLFKEADGGGMGVAWLTASIQQQMHKCRQAMHDITVVRTAGERMQMIGEQRAIDRARKQTVDTFLCVFCKMTNPFSPHRPNRVDCQARRKKH